MGGHQKENQAFSVFYDLQNQTFRANLTCGLYPAVEAADWCGVLPVGNDRSLSSNMQATVIQHF